MWFTRFGEYINRGWKEAAIVALIFSIIPLMGWVAVVIMALITLRKGPQQGLFILLITALPSLLFWSSGFGFVWVLIVLSGNVLTWLLAIVLRETSDWGKVLSASLLFVVLLTVVLHLFVPDVQGYWYNMLQQMYSEANKDTMMLLQVPAVNAKQYFFNVSRIMMPVLLVMQLLVVLTNLLIGRWWQGKMFNPGGFGEEIYQAKLSTWCSIILLASIVAIYMGESAAWDVLPVLILMFFFVGVIVFNKLAEFWKTKTAFMWLFYGLIVLLFPYSLVVVAGLGVADSFVDFRAKIARSTKSGEK